MSETGTQCLGAQAKLAIQNIELNFSLHSTGNQANWELETRAKKKNCRLPILNQAKQHFCKFTPKQGEKIRLKLSGG
jgi:hypothetical protein